MMIRPLMATALLLGSVSCNPCDASSYVVSDGVNRAPGVALLCVGAGSIAAPCGTQTQPIVVTPTAGIATSANQAADLSIQQSVSQTLGSPGDQAYAGGSGSMIALLKGFIVSLESGTQALPFGGQPVSRTTSVAAGLSTQLFPVNSGRHYLAFQVPASSAVWVNFVGGAAGANAADCILLPAGTTYESGQYVVRGSISVYAPVAVTISAWEG